MVDFEDSPCERRDWRAADWWCSTELNIDVKSSPHLMMMMMMILVIMMIESYHDDDDYDDHVLELNIDDKSSLHLNTVVFLLFCFTLSYLTIKANHLSYGSYVPFLILSIKEKGTLV